MTQVCKNQLDVGEGAKLEMIKEVRCVLAVQYNCSLRGGNGGPSGLCEALVKVGLPSPLVLVVHIVDSASLVVASYLASAVPHAIQLKRRTRICIRIIH